MSKKIWRGEIFHHSDRVNLNPWTRNENCTVILDSACFPVKEAMALIRAWEECKGYGVVNARIKYLRAVERMKKKVSKK